jgi:hypothetical protein
LHPLNQVLLKVDKALNDEIVTDSGVKLFLDPSYSKEWHSAVTATVAGLPIKPSLKDKKILDNINEGDEVAMSYQVVADLEFKGDGNRFMKVTEDNPYFQEYASGAGEWIKCYALPTRKGLAKATWVGTYFDKRNNFIDGCQGGESDLQRWMSQFQFDKTDIYNHCNLFSYNGEDYWKANPNQIFAKKVDGHIVAVGNRIICKPIDEPLPAEMKGNIIQTTDVKIRFQDRARVISSPIESIKKDYIISFRPIDIERYEIWGQTYYLINERFVQGVWQKKNKDNS